MTLLDQWVDFICSPAHAGRYLYAGGNARLTATTDINPNRLSEFLTRLNVISDDPLLLYRLHYLLQSDVRRFFERSLPELIRSASHITAGAIEHSRRGARGKILWPQTLRLRASGRGDTATFAVRIGEKSSDVPENRLLKLFLLDVLDTITATAKIVSTGAVIGELEQIKRQTQIALKTPVIGQVSREYKATPLMRQRARRNRNTRYSELADLQQQLDQSLRYQKWVSILQLLQQNWLKPINEDDIFELYTLVLLLDVIAVELGFGAPLRYGLIRRNRKGIAHFHRADGVTADVYFDQSPMEVFRMRSEYTTVLKDYDGIRGAEHRPDIIVRFRISDIDERRLLIESKRTDDSKYKRDSVYKVLAYLRDFIELWRGMSTQSPKAILVFPQGVRLKTGTTEAGRDLVFISGEDRARFAYLLESVISAPTQGETTF